MIERSQSLCRGGGKAAGKLSRAREKGRAAGTLSRAREEGRAAGKLRRAREGAKREGLGEQEASTSPFGQGLRPVR